jgi:hypothetical protein
MSVVCEYWAIVWEMCLVTSVRGGGSGSNLSAAGRYVLWVLGGGVWMGGATDWRQLSWFVIDGRFKSVVYVGGRIEKSGIGSPFKVSSELLIICGKKTCGKEASAAPVAVLKLAVVWVVHRRFSGEGIRRIVA